jgi:hypothetical protein
MHAATDDVAAAIVVVVVVVVVVGAKAKPYKRTPAKSAVKSSTVEPPHEASMKATTVEATASEASMEAGMMSLTRLGHFRSGIIRQSKERSR